MGFEGVLTKDQFSVLAFGGVQVIRKYLVYQQFSIVHSVRRV